MIQSYWFFKCGIDKSKCSGEWVEQSRKSARCREDGQGDDMKLEQPRKMWSHHFTSSNRAFLNDWIGYEGELECHQIWFHSIWELRILVWGWNRYCWPGSCMLDCCFSFSANSPSTYFTILPSFSLLRSSSSALWYCSLTLIRLSLPSTMFNRSASYSSSTLASDQPRQLKVRAPHVSDIWEFLFVLKIILVR